MAEYNQTLYQALWEFPIAVAIIFMPIAIQRSGGDVKGPNYTQDASINARNRARAFLEEHYTIVDDPTLPWQLG